MKHLDTHDIKGQTCYCVGDEVWVAKKDGGLKVYHSLSGNYITDVLFVPFDGEDRYNCGTFSRIIKHFVLVYGQLWGTTVSGDVLIFDVDSHKQVERIRGPLGESNQLAALTDICFNGSHVLVASESGCLILLHPVLKKVIGQLELKAPCTCVCHAHRLVIAGDRQGRLYVFDPDFMRCLSVLEDAAHPITCVVHDPVSDTVWVGSKDGRLYGYELSNVSSTLIAKRVLEDTGYTTSLFAVSGTVVATTKERFIVAIDAASGTVVSRTKTDHSAHIRGATRTHRREEAYFWTYCTQGLAHEWHVRGGLVSDCTPHSSKLDAPSVQVNSPVHSDIALLQGRRSVNIPLERERMLKTTAREAMRDLIDEVQELRLKFVCIQEALHSKDIEIDKRKKREEELIDENEKLRKELLDWTSALSLSKSECISLQSDLNRCRDDLSKARTDSNNAQTDKSVLEGDISRVKIEKAQVEQQLMDAQSTVSGLRAEAERLLRSIGSLGSGKEKENEIIKKCVESEVEIASSVLHYKKLNRLLTSILATMEYTIRRKEEEEQDLTCLLNAFRHRVVDHTSDPHLTALLNATVVRNPARFSYSCDSATLAEIQDRSAPLQQFLQSLRHCDPDAYSKLIAYLQQSASATLAPDGKRVLDNFITLAVSETKFTDDSLASFRRSIPVLFLSDSKDTPAAPPGETPSSGSATTTMEIARKAKSEEDITMKILHNYHSQIPLETEAMQKEQQTFEFILTTRRGLADQLAHLFHRLTMAQMACGILTAPSSNSTAPPPDPSSPVSNHSQLITGITVELHEVVERIVRRFLTTDEKIRLGVPETV